MFNFVQSWLGPKSNPIGVDFGSDALRLAQVQLAGGEHRLIAAASADVPSHVRDNLTARLNFFAETTRELLSQGHFKGREAMLALPAAWMHIQHLRMPKLDDEALRKALPWESRGKLPIDPSQALLRHLVAGDIFHDAEPRSEVIVMAALRETVNQFLAATGKAKLDVVGMHVEPQAMVDCFSHVYRRKNDAEVVNCFIDIGCVATRAIVTRASQIFFARVIPIGGNAFTQAVADAMSMSFSDAKLLRIKLAQSQPTLNESRERRTIRADEEGTENSFALLSAGIAKHEHREDSSGTGVATVGATLVSPFADRTEEGDTSVAPTAQSEIELVAQACAEPIARLTAELDLCRRYYETTFPSQPIERLVFVGGEARQRGLCQQIAREMGLAAQVGDPMVRMSRLSDIGIESGIDRRQPQPAWAVALGLSMGPTGELRGQGQ